MNGEVIVTEDVAGAFANLTQTAFDERHDSDRFVMAFGGGSTAKNAYAKLAHENIDWSLVTAIWGDERLVPLDHEDSNYLIAKTELFDQVTPLAAVHTIDDTTHEDDYDKIVSELSPIDLVHLGMGDDGHTASLFPGAPNLESDPHRLVVSAGDEFHAHPRLTLTFSAINQARLAVFTVTGANKAAMFERIRNGEHLPAGRVAAHRVVWLVDPAAAGQ